MKRSWIVLIFSLQVGMAAQAWVSRTQIEFFREISGVNISNSETYYHVFLKAGSKVDVLSVKDNGKKIDDPDRMSVRLVRLSNDPNGKTFYIFNSSKDSRWQSNADGTLTATKDTRSNITSEWVQSQKPGFTLSSSAPSLSAPVAPAKIVADPEPQNQKGAESVSAEPKKPSPPFDPLAVKVAPVAQKREEKIINLNARQAAAEVVPTNVANEPSVERTLAGINNLNGHNNDCTTGRCETSDATAAGDGPAMQDPVPVTASPTTLKFQKKAIDGKSVQTAAANAKIFKVDFTGQTRTIVLNNTPPINGGLVPGRIINPGQQIEAYFSTENDPKRAIQQCASKYGSKDQVDIKMSFCLMLVTQKKCGGLINPDFISAGKKKVFAKLGNFTKQESDVFYCKAYYDLTDKDW
ncbi:MAG: hypothetical protein ACOYOK_00015 [Pseudobdellovibrionaceae bacterium]